MADTGTAPNAPRAKVTVPTIRSRKRSRGDLPLVMLTAYDTPSARIADAAGVDIVLVGDSVANAVLGHTDTLQVDVAVMAHHVAAVGRASTRALVVGDMPWLSYHLSPGRLSAMPPSSCGPAPRRSNWRAAAPVSPLWKPCSTPRSRSWGTSG